MCSKQNRRFKFERVQHDYRNKLIENINKAYIMWMYKWKFDGIKCNSNQKLNKNKCQCECKKSHTCEKIYICNPATCSSKNGKYLASIIDNSVITCDKITDAEAKETIPTNFNEKNL